MKQTTKKKKKEKKKKRKMCRTGVQVNNVKLFGRVARLHHDVTRVGQVGAHQVGAEAIERHIAFDGSHGTGIAIVGHDVFDTRQLFGVAARPQTGR